jgi:hypothetical protein
MRYLLLIICTAFLACSGRDLPRTGETAVVKSNAQEGALAAFSEDSYNAMDRVSIAMDERGLQNLITAGEVVIVPNNDAGLVLDIEPGYYKIRMQTGDHAGKILYIAPQFLSK